MELFLSKRRADTIGNIIRQTVLIVQYSSSYNEVFQFKWFLRMLKINNRRLGIKYLLQTFNTCRLHGYNKQKHLKKQKSLHLSWQTYSNRECILLMFYFSSVMVFFTIPLMYRSTTVIVEIKIKTQTI